MRNKIILSVAIILLFGVVFFNRVAVKEFVLSWPKNELPEAVEYSVIASDQRERSNLNGAINIGLSESEIKSDDKIASSSRQGGTPRNDTNSQLPVTNYQLPITYNLAVPFQPQAPRANWGMPYQEACEEASLIMADAFFNKKSLTAEEMDNRIKDLVDWEVKRFEYYEDTTAEEVVVIAREYFGLRAELDTNVSIENIKKYISQNKLVITPAAGKILPNPYFRSGGPLYHMLVIRGYTQDKFITNDPGTKRGKEFVYKYNDLINAIHDWPGPTGGSRSDVSEAEILTGRPVLIVIDNS